MVTLFRIVVTSAVFQIFGEVPDVNESLIIAIRVERIDGKQFFKTHTLSFPGTFRVGIELITFSTSLHSTTPNENCCAKG